MKKNIITLMIALIMSIGYTFAQYQIGDIVDIDGVTAIVVLLDDSSEHGLLMSVEASSEKWCTKEYKEALIECSSEDDGAINMVAIENYIAANNTPWSEFPLFEWAKSLGQGWYIPSVNEMLNIWGNINGDTLSFNYKNAKIFSKILKDAGGDSMIDSGFGGTNTPKGIFTSTQTVASSVYKIQFFESGKSIVKGMLIGGKKKGGELKAIAANKDTGGKILFQSRAVMKF